MTPMEDAMDYGRTEWLGECSASSGPKRQIGFIRFDRAHRSVGIILDAGPTNEELRRFWTEVAACRESYR